MPGHEIKKPRNQVVPYRSSISLSGCGLDKVWGEIGDSKPCASHLHNRHLHVAVVHDIVSVFTIGIVNSALTHRDFDNAVCVFGLLPCLCLYPQWSTKFGAVHAVRLPAPHCACLRVRRQWSPRAPVCGPRMGCIQVAVG